MLKANLRNQVRQTPLPKWKPLIPLFEAVMNSIQAIRDAKRPKGNGFVDIEIEREGDLTGNQGQIRSFTIKDNGIGLDDTNFDSFNTAYSDHKESVGGKGLGRFTWLKAFEAAEIASVFHPKGEEPLLRQFTFNEHYDPDDGVPAPAPGRSTGTAIRLIGFRDPYRKQFAGTAEQLTLRLVEHFLLIFLEQECPRISVRDGTFAYSANETFERDFRATARIHSFKIKEVDFALHGFRLSTPRLAYHKLIYAANQRGVVSDNLRDHIPNLSGRLPDANGGSFVYLGVLQSPYLTQHVNAARTDFDIAGTEDADVDQEELFVEEIRRQEIRDQALALIQEDLTAVIGDINREKEERLRTYIHAEAPQYKILLRHVGDFINKIAPGASKTDIELALHRELHQREVELKREGSRIIKEAEKIDDYEGYRGRLKHFMENYNELGVAALAQHVVHRRILLEFLQRAISTDPNTDKFPLEEVVHRLVFPMRATSEDIPSHEQNLWIIDERLAYHSFLASDKRLDAIPDHLESGSALRPDLLIFDEAIIYSADDRNVSPVNSMTIIEFKRPGRDDYNLTSNPVNQIFDLVEKVHEGTFKVRGRPISTANQSVPTTAYAVCDLTPSLRKVLQRMSARMTPDGQCFYGYHDDLKVYWQVVEYGKLLRDAERRNKIFFDKLNIIGR